MHDSGVMERLLATIECVARENFARRVIAVDVDLGAPASFTADDLRERFRTAAAGTVAEFAEVRVTECADPGFCLLLRALEIET